MMTNHASSFADATKKRASSRGWKSWPRHGERNDAYKDYSRPEAARTVMTARSGADARMDTVDSAYSLPSISGARRDCASGSVAMATVAAVATAAVADAAMKHDMINSPLLAVVLRRECGTRCDFAVPGVTP